MRSGRYQNKRLRIAESPLIENKSSRTNNVLKKTTLERKGQQQRRFTVPCLELQHVARGASPPPYFLLSSPFFILGPPFVPDPFCLSAGWQSDIVGHGRYVMIHLLAGANSAEQQIRPLSAQMLVHTNKQR